MKYTLTPLNKTFKLHLLHLNCLTEQTVNHNTISRHEYWVCFRADSQSATVLLLTKLQSDTSVVKSHQVEFTTCIQRNYDKTLSSTVSELLSRLNGQRSTAWRWTHSCHLNTTQQHIYTLLFLKHNNIHNIKQASDTPAHIHWYTKYLYHLHCYNCTAIAAQHTKLCSMSIFIRQWQKWHKYNTIKEYKTLR